jgi:hypothetical protein
VYVPARDLILVINDEKGSRGRGAARPELGRERGFDPALLDAAGPQAGP